MTVGARLDQHLVHTGLARSRTAAQRLIRSGAVMVDGATATKSSYVVGPGQQVQLTHDPEHHWVGRGALKLAHALSVWPIPVTGRRCLDVGASTGGFTQVLLEHGAAEVTALDVGHSQLVPELAQDPRVRDLPGTNIRHADPADLGTFDVIVGDVSFISLTLVLPTLPSLLRPEGEVIFLVKPQFEVGRQRLGRRGIVTSAEDRASALTQVVRVGTTCGWQVAGLERSPVTGTHGNTEYLLWLRNTPVGMMEVGTMKPEDTTARIQELTREED